MKFKKTNLYVYPYFHDFVFIHYIHTREYDKKPNTRPTLLQTHDELKRVQLYGKLSKFGHQTW